MTFVIGAACVDVMDMSCVQECPVDCIYQGARTMCINPDECVHCGAYKTICRVEAIYWEGRSARVAPPMYVRLASIHRWWLHRRHPPVSSSPDSPHHEYRTPAAPEVGGKWTDHLGDLVGILGCHHRMLHGFMRAGQKFSGPISGGSRTDVHFGMLSDPTAEPSVQLAVGNFTETPSPDSHRQDRCFAK